jgi:hypothetical protein
MAAFTDSGVQVRVAWLADADVMDPIGESRSGVQRRGALVVTFTPLQSGFHLYTLNLPAKGLDGVGRPTLVEVGGALQAAGLPATAEPTNLESIVGAAQPMPVYPAGAVTVWLPVSVLSRSGSTGSGSTGVEAARAGASGHVWIGYAACSGQLCLAPVTRHLVEVQIPSLGSGPGLGSGSGPR